MKNKESYTINLPLINPRFEAAFYLGDDIRVIRHVGEN